jgi:uracil-DNA glycosylase
MFFEAMHPVWQGLLADQKPTLERIEKALAEAGQGSSFLPAAQHVMRAFETDPNSIRVLIVGQDPYPTPGHAIGLAFACQADIRPQPRSLKNIRAELESDLGVSAERAEAVDLARWAEQGVMLLNRTLTVAPGQPHSHLNLGWQAFTATTIERLAALRGEQLVAILWGKPAQAVVPWLGQHVLPEAILTSAHPSPLSARRGFFGSKPFSKTNVLLEKRGLHKIDWFG